jgi:DNA (cytosine-5)-methyltransferase 1
MNEINRPVRVLSLFSGVGGFDMGLEAAGMTTVFQCEIDKHARSVLDYHWPETPKWDDVSTLTGAYILEQTGGVDVVAWGSPCQDLSIAGKRAGLTGERSGLFHQGIRIIKELRELTNGKSPTWSIWENVTGALSSNRGADFGEVLYEMDEAGACFSEWALLDAQHFGVPQRRRRVFLTSCFNSSVGAGCPEPLFPVAQSVSGDSAKGNQKGQGSAGTVTASPRSGSESVTFVLDRASFNQGENAKYEPVIEESTVMPSLVARGPHAVAENKTADDNPVLMRMREGKDGGGKGPLLSDSSLTLAQSNDQTLFQKSEPVTFAKSRRAQSDTDHETWLESDVTPTLNIFDVGDVRTTVAVVEPIIFENSYRDGARIGTEGLSQTLSAKMGTGGNNTPMVTQPVAYSIREDAKANNFSSTEVETARALQAMQPSVQSHHAQTFIAHNQPLVVRRLTPLECERLMGWPDNHTSQGVNGKVSDTQRYRMCGNGVASPVAKWVGEQIMKVGL